MKRASAHGKAIQAGMEKARQSGKQLGRPRLSKAVERRIRASLQSGNGILRTAKLVGVGVSAVQRIKGEQRKQPK